MSWARLCLSSCMHVASQILGLCGVPCEIFYADAGEVGWLEGAVSLLPVGEERRDGSGECADVEVCAFGATPLEVDRLSRLVCGGLHSLGRLEGYDLVEVVELEYLDPHVGGLVVPYVGGYVVVYVPDGVGFGVECGCLVGVCE